MWAEKEFFSKNCQTVHILKDNSSPPPNDGITYDTRPAFMGDLDSMPKKDGNERVENRAAKPKTITFGPAAPLSQPQTHPHEMSKQKQNVLVTSMGPGYPKVIEGISQMESSLKTTERVQKESNSNFNLEMCSTGQSDQEPRTRTLVHGFWAEDLVEQTSGLGSLPNYVTESGSKDRTTLNIDSKGANEKHIPHLLF